MSTTISRMRSAAAWMWAMRWRSAGGSSSSSRSISRRPITRVSGLLISWAAPLASRAMVRSSSAALCSVMSMRVVSRSPRGAPESRTTLASTQMRRPSRRRIWISSLTAVPAVFTRSSSASRSLGCT